MAEPTLDALRRYAVARSLFPPTTLPRAIQRLGFVQADPIRAPARAQDLTLRHRVKDYRAGDLERRYAKLAVEEDCLVNYGFLPREHLALMHPRQPRKAWDAATQRLAADVLAFVRTQGVVHPRAVEQQFASGRAQNAWGGSGRASTQLLDGLHYRGLLRVARRESGTRLYEAVTHATPLDDPVEAARRAAALVDLVVRKYAPLPAASLTYLVRLLGYGAPHLAVQTRAALGQARERLGTALVDGTRWYWPQDENPASRRHAPDDAVRLLAPFDPVVWDRRRFALLWGWTYRFEAYTPAPKRQLGYYALPMLWKDRVVGWASFDVGAGGSPRFGYADGKPSGRAFRAALDDELQRMSLFLSPR